MLIAGQPDLLPINGVDPRITPHDLSGRRAPAPGARAFELCHRSLGPSWIVNTGGVVASGSIGTGPGASSSCKGDSAVASVLSLPAFANTTAMYGSTAAEIPKTQVYHP